jgi:hypothetical protein
MKGTSATRRQLLKAGLIGVAVFGVITASAIALRIQNNKQSTLQAKAAGTSIQTSTPIKTQPKALASTTSDSSASTQAAGDAETSDDTISGSRTAPSVMNPSTCSSTKAARAQAEYSEEIRKEKDALDTTLKPIQFGVDLTAKYVADYNAKATKLFQDYSSVAKAENCSFPFKAPATLPLDYQHANQ